MDPILGLLRSLDVPGHLAAVVPELASAVAPSRARIAGAVAPCDEADRRRLEAEGLVTMPGLLPASTCDRLVGSIRKLVAAGYPATFVYAFDATWQAGERVRERVSTLVGARYELIADAWAWEIPPGRRGWPAHRGVAEPHLDRARPEILDAWLALSDVEADRSCLSFVPLEDDAHYPGAMDRVDAPLESARALPVAAGTALAWNANVLHWGGPCSPRADGPRVSCSFTLYRADAAPRFGPTLMLEQLDYRARMELIAQQILTYGAGQPDVSSTVFGWARTLCDMRTAARKEG